MLGWYVLFKKLCSLFKGMIRWSKNWNFMVWKLSSDCACKLNCPNGCDGCPNPICSCGENLSSEDQDNLNSCVRGKSLEFGQCYLNCERNAQCKTSCFDVFESEFESCPCQVSLGQEKSIFQPWVVVRNVIFQTECLGGCPCDNYDCEPDKKSLLVLNTHFTYNTPVLIKYDGEFRHFRQKF